jgi:dTMP kinase
MKGRNGQGCGFFVCLEGLDGAGTTTQAERLCAALSARGHRVVPTREPSEGPVGVLIRQALSKRVVLPAGAGPLTSETLALLFAADRVDHLASCIAPALRRGDVVVSDRYLLSSLAYQSLSSPMGWISEINRAAPPADLTLFLDVSPRVAAGRRKNRGGSAELFEVDALQRKIRRQYQKAISARARKERIVTLDGTASPDEVAAAILESVLKAVG